MARRWLIGALTRRVLLQRRMVKDDRFAVLLNTSRVGWRAHCVRGAAIAPDMPFESHLPVRRSGRAHAAFR
jgi:hypothetical protein